MSGNKLETHAGYIDNNLNEVKIILDTSTLIRQPLLYIQQLSQGAISKCFIFHQIFRFTISR
jgi:hypothetical protein